MTTTPSLFDNLAAGIAGSLPGARPAATAQPTPTRTRSFDAVFAEAIDDRPETAAGLRPADRPAPPAEPGQHAPEQAPSDQESPPTGEGAEEQREARSEEPVASGEVIAEEGQAPPEEGIPEHEPERAEHALGDERPAIDPQDRPIRGKRAARLWAGAVRAEVTHAAEVDLASLNATELTQAHGKRDAAWQHAATTDEDAQRGEPGQRQPAAPPTPKGEHAARSGDAPVGASAKPDAPGHEQPTPRTQAGAAGAAPAPAAAPPAAAPPAPAAASTAAQEAMARLSSLGARAAAAAQAAPAASSPGSTPAVSPGPQAAQRLTGVGAGAKAQGPTPTRQPVLAQVQRGLASVLKGGGGTTTLRLQPEALGQVKVEVTLKGGAATARFEASTPSAHRLLTDNLSTLRQALEAKGVKVESLSVEMRSVEQAPPEAARGERPGTDAGRGRQGDGPPVNADGGAGSETGAGDNGHAGEDAPGPWASKARPAGIAGAGPGSEHPEDADADPIPIAGAGTPGHGGWIGLDTVA